MHTSRSNAARPLPRLVAVLGILAVCLGASSSSCSWGDSDDDNDDDDGGNDDQPSFVTTLELRDVNGDISAQFDRGERIEVRLIVRNRLDTAVDLDFDSTRVSDFIVVEENTDDIVWKWSDEQPPFADIPTTITFQAGESKSYDASWDQRGDTGNQVRAGTYEARGVLVYDDFDTNPLRSNQTASTLVRFTIE